MKKILIIEDDSHISNMLCDLLVQNQFSPTPAYSGTEGLMCFENNKYDLILLDLMLPGKAGLEVLLQIRESSNVPVIALTAVDSKESIVALLKAGANDYVTKPFDNDVLLARIEVQLRSEEKPACSSLCFKSIALNPEQFDAFINGKAVGLSKKEFEILKLMISSPKKVFTKNNLYESVWNDEFLGDDNTINVHISKIRNKLAQLEPECEFIQTVWGIGFKMQE